VNEPDAPTLNRSEMIVRTLTRGPALGMTRREVAIALSADPNIISGLLTRLKRRRVVACDPVTQLWRVTARDAPFKARSVEALRADGDTAPLRPEPGVTAEDLAWMQSHRAKADARRARSGGAR
jgi:hypothetical protein